MKTFFMRFFTHKDFSVPYDSWAIGSETSQIDERKKIVEQNVSFIVNWFKQHPKGKVDFVWL